MADRQAIASVVRGGGGRRRGGRAPALPRRGPAARRPGRPWTRRASSPWCWASGGVPVVTFDERLTTVSAEAALAQAGKRGPGPPAVGRQRGGDGAAPGLAGRPMTVDGPDAAAQPVGDGSPERARDGRRRAGDGARRPAEVPPGPGTAPPSGAPPSGGAGPRGRGGAGGGRPSSSGTRSRPTPRGPGAARWSSSRSSRGRRRPRWSTRWPPTGSISSAFAFRVSTSSTGRRPSSPGTTCSTRTSRSRRCRRSWPAGPNVFAVDVDPGFTLAEVAEAHGRRSRSRRLGLPRVANERGRDLALRPTGFDQPRGAPRHRHVPGPAGGDATPGSSRPMVARFDTTAAAAGLTAAAAAALGDDALPAGDRGLDRREGGLHRQEHGPGGPGHLQPAERRHPAPDGLDGAVLARPGRGAGDRRPTSSSTPRTTPTCTPGCRRPRSASRRSTR